MYAGKRGKKNMNTKMLLIAGILLGIVIVFAWNGCSKKNGDTVVGTNNTNPPTNSPSSPMPLASGLMNPVGIAVDGSSVYWTESQDGTNADSGMTWVKKVSLTDGIVSTLYLKTGQPNYVNTWSIAIDANYVYWTESNQDSMCIKKVGKNGGPAVTLASQYPYKLSIDASNVYFTDGGNGLTYGYTVGKIGKNGGSVTPVAIGQTQEDGIRVFSGNVYWVSIWDGCIYKTGISGGGVTPLVNVSGSYGFAVDSTGLYYVNLDSTGTKGIIKRTGLTGGAVLEIARSGMPRELILDANNIYWTDNLGIYKASKNGGSTSFIPLTGSPWDITMDSLYIYWLDGSNVSKILKW
jgi:hypothetical protein